jgi:uncharacterized surface protein with fasciclin (FAS1) repeats
MQSKFWKIVAVMSVSVAGLAYAGPAAAPGADGAAPAEAPAATQTIAEIVSASPDHSTLAGLLKETGLIGAFSGSGGTFTLFAPTDAAFAKLGNAKLDELKQPKNRGKLMEILTSHASTTKLMAADIKGGDVTMMSQKKIPVKVADGKVMIGGATVVKADLAATNGVVHVIDAVIVPK